MEMEIYNNRNSADHSEDESNSPELLEMTEEYNNDNDNDDDDDDNNNNNNNPTNTINYIKKGNININKKDIGVKKNLNKNIFKKKSKFYILIYKFIYTVE